MFEFKESKLKNGTRLILCNMLDLLLDRFQVSSETELLSFVNGNGEYICHCPFCEKEGHTKKKLYINEDYENVGGHCFVCGTAFKHISNKINLSFPVPDFFNSVSIPEFHIEPMSDPKFTLNKFFEFDQFSVKGEEYLANRQPFMRQLIKPLGFRFWNDNVVIPFFDFNGNVMYYQIRFINAIKHGVNSGFRYFFPKIGGNSGSGKPPYILDFKTGSRSLIIVEGVFDAIAAFIMSGGSFIPVAVLGSSISNYQMSFLRQMCPDSIAIMMDEYPISKNIRDKIITVFNHIPVNIVPNNGEADPEEILNDRCKKGLPVVWLNPGMFNNQNRWRLPNYYI